MNEKQSQVSYTSGMNDIPKILIVDDEPDIQKMMEISLRQRGYHILLATNGAEAVDLAAKERPDLILLDVMLPVMDGMAACRRIKGNANTFVPIILVTVKNDLKNKISGMDHGADDYLTKPFIIEELVTRVASMLRIKKLYDEQERASITDPLTGAYNRRYFQVRLKEECDRAQRYDGRFACLMLDLDHFKKINDAHGHGAGDDVLKQFAALIRNHIRRTDIFVRYGGEEFVLILPQSELAEAQNMAEALRKAIEKNDFSHQNKRIKATCSFGVCLFPSPGIGDFESLVKHLDDALYQAKEGGRNRVSVYNKMPDSKKKIS